MSRTAGGSKSRSSAARAATAMQVIVCADSSYVAHPFVIRSVPIRVPSLRTRRSHLPRIVEEYGADAVEELSADATGFTAADRDWVLEHSTSTLAEIEKGTRRLVAIRQGGNINRAAKRLGSRTSR